MKRGLRIVATVLLVALAAALAAGILTVYGRGGRMEVTLMVFGDPVWLKVRMGSPRFLLLLLIPGVFLGAAYSLRAWRSG
jgi:hypothetical protein